MIIKKMTDKVIVDDVKAEGCCCHDCAEKVWAGKSCSGVKGCYKKAKLTAKYTKRW